MIKDMLDIFTFFDCISPLIGIYQDTVNLFTTPSSTIWLGKYDIGQARKVLKQKGVKVLSTTTVAMDDEGGIDVSRQQEELVRLLLNQAGIETW